MLLHNALALRGRTDTTRAIAVEKLQGFRRAWGDDKPLAEIDWPLLSEYLRARLEVDGASRLTVSGELGYLRQAWKLARAVGWAPRPWDEVMPERFDRDYKPRTRWLRPAELERVLRALKPERAAFVAWIVATGADLGDVYRVEDGDVDWKRGLVRVRGTKTVFRDRWVPITPITRPLLKLAAEHGPPFRKWSGVQCALARVATKLKIDRFSPKDLRRTHGQWLHSAGVEPHLIGRVLGHADSEMADRVYAQGDELAIARLVRMSVRMRATKPRDRPRKTSKR